MKKNILFSLMLLCFFPVLSSADSYSGQELFDNCKSGADILDSVPISEAESGMRGFYSARCAGYILGFYDMHMVMAMYHTDMKIDDYRKKLLFCIPDNIKTTQLVRIVVAYGKEHPENLNLSAYVFLIKAFQNFYPCGTK